MKLRLNILFISSFTSVATSVLVAFAIKNHLFIVTDIWGFFILKRKVMDS